jgi:hypothetical protein
LADKLAELVRDPALADQLGRRGQAAVSERYTAAAMAAAHREFYYRVVSGQPMAAPTLACPEGSS